MKTGYWFKTILLVGIFLALILAGCRKSSAETGITPGATRTPAPQPTATPAPPTQTPTLTPTPDPYGWQALSLDGFTGLAAQGDNPGCAELYPDLEPGELLLGADPQTCEPLLRWVQVDLPLDVAGAAAGDWLALRITCAGEGSCLHSGGFEPGTGAARFDLMLGDPLTNGSYLWQSDCAKPGMCQPDGENRPIQATLRKPSSGVLNLSLMTAAGAVWRVESIEVALLPPPSQPGLLQGYAYSPFRSCQMPGIGPFPSDEELRQDLLRLTNSTDALRTYSSQDVNAEIARQAHALGFKLVQGVAIGADEAKNQEEIEAAASLASQVQPEFLIVGNEVILRGERTPQQVADDMLQVKQKTGLPVAYAEIGSFFVQSDASGNVAPRQEMLPIIEAADYLLVHIYPYWDGVAAEQGAAYVLSAYQILKDTFPDKHVVIGETGWPSRGEPRGDALPSPENQRRFFMEFTALAEREGVEYFYFSPFDEPWKANEGEVGPSWGVADVARQDKFESEALHFPRLAPQEIALLSWPASGASPTGAAPTGTPPTQIATDQTAGTSPVPPPLVLYSQFPFPAGLSPSRWQGDVADIRINPCWGVSVHSSPDALRLDYTAESLGDPQAKGWAGFVWESPQTPPQAPPQGSPEELPQEAPPATGSDLSAYNQVRFYARGEQGGERVTFFFGGERSNLAACQQGLISCDAQTLPPMLPVTLTRDWQLYTIDLGDQPLASVVDGLGWVTSACQNPAGASFFLDDIELVSAPPPADQPLQPFVLLEDGCLAPGFDLGIDTSEGERQWASPAQDAIRLEYPAWQDWGAAFFFVDLGTWEQRPYIDLSQYSTLEVELSGPWFGSRAQVGMKDNDDPDDGSERKRSLELSTEWRTFQFPLTVFRRGSYANPARIYIPLELVFGSSDSLKQEFYIRSVRLLP